MPHDSINQDESLLLAVEKWNAGDQEGAKRLVSAFYDHLRGIARHQARHERPAHTVDPTGIVHEAYAKLASQVGRKQLDRPEHFLGIAASCLREAWVDYARRHRRLKRRPLEPDRALETRELEAVADPQAIQFRQVLEINDLLEALSEVDPMAAQIVELHYFAGVTFPEAVEIMGSSIATLKRKWQTARLWLAEQLSRDALPEISDDR